MTNKKNKKIKTKFGGYGKYFSEGCTRRFVSYMKRLRGYYRVTYMQYQVGVGISPEYMQGLENMEKLLRRDMFIIDSCIGYFVNYHNGHIEFNKRGMVEFNDMKSEVLLLLRDNFDKQVIDFRRSYFGVSDTIFEDSFYDNEENQEMKLLF
jgi:hypothetical protein